VQVDAHPARRALVGEVRVPLDGGQQRGGHGR
jgi:hypothetical protein